MVHRLLALAFLVAALLGVGSARTALAASVPDCCASAAEGSAPADDEEPDDCCDDDVGACHCSHACLGPAPAPVAWPDLGDGRSWDATAGPRPRLRAVLPPPTPPPIG